MDPIVLIGVLFALVGLLILLGMWQRKIDQTQKEQVVADIQDAEERGTHKPLAQHPQIDEQACIGCGSCIDVCPEDGVLGLVDGVAKVIHGARCIGHGLCATACPVAAVKVGLGEIASRPDIPILTQSLETTLPGTYIAGELGGFALIRIAIDQGAQTVDAIARDLASSAPVAQQDDRVDLLIVGSGPAGLGATLKAVELGLSYVTIDQDDVGGTVRKYPRRKLTLTGPMTLPLHGPVRRTEFLKEELIEFWQELIEKYELRIHSGVKFLGLDGEKDAFTARTSEGLIPARRVLLALGRRGSPRKLNVPGEETEKVLYQLVDASTYNGERLLIVGGGDSAVEAAVALASQDGNVVSLSYRRDQFFRIKQRNQERIEEFGRAGKVRLILNSTVDRIEKDRVILSCRSEAGTKKFQLKNDYVFVLAGGDPPYPLLASLGVNFGGEAAEEPPKVEETKLVTVEP